VEAEVADGLRVNAGVRYEQAEEVVNTGLPRNTLLDNGYWLPTATVTWNFAADMQLRLHGSKTIARPQFRELAPQIYQDFESDRQFFGNPLLVDSELLNFEGRYEWFFARDQQVTLAGFYKRIDNPIETVAFFPAGAENFQIGFANAPRGTLYGGEIEARKYSPLADWLGGDFFATRRLVLIANYTYTKSEIQAGTQQVFAPLQPLNGNPVTQQASQLFRDGGPLVGQSDHLVNLQLGIEDTERLSQITALFTYASERVTNRGPVAAGGGTRLPDLIEKPGIRFDIVARQGFSLGGADFELKFEARNLTGTRYQEYQIFDNGRRVDTNTFNLGRVFSLGISARI
jgi:outer membrane receptor protein involved in Fe transport